MLIKSRNLDGIKNRKLIKRGRLNRWAVAEQMPHAEEPEKYRQTIGDFLEQVETFN